MSDEEKQKVLDEVNEETEEFQGNTSITTLSEMDDISKRIEEMSPKELFETNVNSNIRACYELDRLADQLSKKNLKKLLLATLKLPEENASLNFGGTTRKLAEYAFIQSQVALNSKIHITVCGAAERSKREREEQAKQSEETKGESNE